MSIEDYNRITKKQINLNDYIGQRIRNFVVVEEGEPHNVSGKKYRMLNCLCDCGSTFTIPFNRIKKISNCPACSRRINAQKLKKDYIGKRFNNLVVLEELTPHITPGGAKQRIVRCKCDCGNVFAIRLSAVKKDHNNCSKCRSYEEKIKIGQRFGKLTVSSKADSYIYPSGQKQPQYNCLCDCGNLTIVRANCLLNGSIKSCGCLVNTAGLLKDNSELLKKYDFEKNNELGIDLEKIAAKSSKKVWWKCSNCGNSWFSTVSSQYKSGCPYCSGNLAVKGKNDLLSQYPQIAEEWDYEKNGEVAPDKVTQYSSYKAWWVCKECGFSWKTSVGLRTTRASRCPKCTKETKSSFPEQAIFYYIKKIFPDALNGDKHIGMELDIFIPSRMVAIEYDGQNWHRESKKIKVDLQKNQICLDNNIELIRVREAGLESMNNCTTFVRDNPDSDSSLDEIIVTLIEYLSPMAKIDINVTRDTPIILDQFVAKKHDNSLLALYPNLAKEWHPQKNGTLSPDKVNKGSKRKIWWMGECGHEWQATILHRTYGRGCPYCSNNKLLKGFNDLQTKYPEIAKEWHPTKNGDLKPTDVTSASAQKVWWLGNCGHEWNTTINSRTSIRFKNGKQSKPQGCPICAGKEVLKGFNDLQTNFPKIALGWNYNRNGELKPSEVTPSSMKKVWWKCTKCGSEWESQICSRTRSNGKCPFCETKKKHHPVKCIETGIVYNNIQDAVSFANISQYMIYKCCNGRTKSAGGYHWEYVN